MAKRKHYKSIEFDLDTKKLQEFYKDYRTAYRDIRGFMTKHGYIHRQGSVYNSKEKLLETDILVLVDELRHFFLGHLLALKLLMLLTSGSSIAC